MANKHTHANFETKKKGMTVHVKNNDVTSAFRSLKKRSQREGIVKELRRKEYYMSQGQRRRKNLADAKKRERKRLQEKKHEN